MIPLAEELNRVLSFSECHDYRNQIISDLNFHKKLVAFARSESLVNAWNALGNLYWFFIYYHSNMDMVSEARKHVGLLNAIKKEDIDDICHLLDIHFDQNRKQKRPLSIASLGGKL